RLRGDRGSAARPALDPRSRGERGAARLPRKVEPPRRGCPPAPTVPGRAEGARSSGHARRYRAPSAKGGEDGREKSPGRRAEANRVRKGRAESVGFEPTEPKKGSPP